MTARMAILLAAQYMAMGAALFVSAGTLAWPAGWVFLLLFACATTPCSILLARHDPDLARERTHLFRRGQPVWDQALMAMLIALLIVWMLIPGLDAVRYNTSRMPLGFRCLGAVFMLLAILGGYAVMRQNTYLSPTVRVQSERQHRVISNGAYGVVRHPFYSALIPLFPAASLLLGSWYGVLFSASILLLLAYRAVREERFLVQALPDYDRYRHQVPYRLVPYIW